MKLRLLLGLALAVACACCSARMDRNTGTLNWSPPPALPLARPSASSSAEPAPDKAPPSKSGAVPTESSVRAELPAPIGCSILPDPAPITTDRWVKLQVRLDRGKLGINSHAPERMRRAQSTKRAMGRFAAELWIGCELIERLRFDFPLLAAEPSTAKAQEPSFETAGRFDVTILIPDSDRATRLELVDRAHSTHQRFDWPLRPEQMNASEPQSVRP